jgi:hypothetical protein
MPSLIYSSLGISLRIGMLRVTVMKAEISRINNSVVISEEGIIFEDRTQTTPEMRSRYRMKKIARNINVIESAYNNKVEVLEL